jgi:hypothetical protein
MRAPADEPLDPSLPAWCVAARGAAIAEQQRRREARARLTEDGVEAELWDDVARLLDDEPGAPQREPRGADRCLFLAGVVFFPSFRERPRGRAEDLVGPAIAGVAALAALWWGAAGDRWWLLAAWGMLRAPRAVPPPYLRGVWVGPEGLWVSHEWAEASLVAARADVISTRRHRDHDVSPPAVSLLVEIRGRERPASVVSRVGEHTPALLWMERWADGRARSMPAGAER